MIVAFSSDALNVASDQRAICEHLSDVDSDVLALLAPGQNLINIRAGLRDRVPLSISGVGAGVEITAAGLLSDVIVAARGML